MKLSIITINFNNLAGLKRTYDSVVCQTWTDYEWIVIDGGSTDGSREFIEAHKEKFAYWCSESDKGIYNAMNKGIRHARGKYLLFMNSGDILADEKVLADFERLDWHEDVIAGDVILDGDSSRIATYPEEENLDFDYMRSAGLCHQSTFIKKELFDNYGLYDEKLHIAADWKFFVEVLLTRNCSYRHWSRVVADYDTDGISSRSEYGRLHGEERRSVLKQYRRMIRSIEKREERIRDLDLPVMTILKKKSLAKLKNVIGRWSLKSSTPE